MPTALLDFITEANPHLSQYHSARIVFSIQHMTGSAAGCQSTDTERQTKQTRQMIQIKKKKS